MAGGKRYDKTDKEMMSLNPVITIYAYVEWLPSSETSAAAQ